MSTRGNGVSGQRWETKSSGDKRPMATEMPESKSKASSLLSGVENLVGVGMHLLLLSLFLEGLTLVVRQRISFPIPLTFETQVCLTVPCVSVCLLGAIWFNRSLDLIGVHLLRGENELITHGPFAYVRHPLYSTLLLTIPPLVIIWLSDLLFFIPWVLAAVVSHYVVRLEERGLIEVFGEDYERYRRYVPALLPYKGAGGQRFREDCGSSEPKRLD
jgi:protein-S-isoprenylcysteine O-methyltransferase Ste14